MRKICDISVGREQCFPTVLIFVSAVFLLLFHRDYCRTEMDYIELTNRIPVLCRVECRAAL